MSAHLRVWIGGWFILMTALLLGCRKSAEEVVTFHRDVAPILYARCASCHRPGEAAPFSLLTYADARARASQIVDVTQSRFMPPWLPEPGDERFLHERKLTEAELSVLSRWVAEGSMEGDPGDAPSVPQYTQGWQLGEPDLVLQSLEFELPAAGPDRFRNFVLSVPVEEAHWIRAVELRPSHPQVTHHIRLGVDATNESQRRDAADEGPGYEGMAWGEDPVGQLITWTPGMLAEEGSAEVAWELVPEDKLVLHTHMQPSGKEETVHFRVGFHFADRPPTLHPVILRIGSRDISIPAGEPDFTIRDEYDLPIDVELQFAFPHAHSLCRGIQLKSKTPEGSERTLLEILRFDENWHDTYRFARPVRISKGTRLVTEFTYDNSAENIRNPHNPPTRVVYGSNADDEMADVYLQVIPVKPRQRAVLTEHYDQYELRSKITGYQKSLEGHPGDLWSSEALASCYVAQKEPQRTVEFLESQPQLLRQSQQAKLVLGMAQLANGDPENAEAKFREVLAGDDQLAVVWLGLGQALVRGQKIDEAEKAFQRALELSPRLLVARLDWIDLQVEQGRLDEAAAQCKQAIDLHPTAHQPHLKLADIFARQGSYEKALAQFADARELAPYVYSPRASLAIACYQLGDEPKAAELLNEAFAADPQDPVPHCFLGQIARRKENWEQAKARFQRALDLPLPDTWPASHARQFVRLVYTEQLQLAQQAEDAALARQTATAWLELEPNNQGLQQLLRDLDEAKLNH